MKTKISLNSAIMMLLAIAAITGVVPSSASAKTRASAEPLQLEVYTASDKEFYVTATLIHGKTEGVLVDSQFHDDAAKRLADAVAATKLKLKAIFITHPDTDHYGGIGVLKAAFPDTPIYMTARAVEQFKRTVDQARHLPVPEVLPSSHMSVNGQAIVFLEDLQGDFAPVPANTPVWIPSLRTVIADDLVFRGVHPWLTDSTPVTRAAWRRSLQRLASLHPKRLIPGHQLGYEANSPADDLKFTDSYIAAFEETAKTAQNAPAFIQAMEQRFPDLKSPILLEYGAKSVFAKHAQPGH